MIGALFTVFPPGVGEVMEVGWTEGKEIGKYPSRNMGDSHGLYPLSRLTVDQV